jgi:hypothetical protein
LKLEFERFSVEEKHKNKTSLMSCFLHRLKELADSKQLCILALEQQVLTIEHEASKKHSRIMHLER